MTNTGTGWTDKRPDDNGIYWHWQEGTLPEVLFVHGGFVYDFGDQEPTSIGLFDGRGRWLGPIYASDAEQLAELRRAVREFLTIDPAKDVERWCEIEASLEQLVGINTNPLSRTEGDVNG